MATPRKVGGYAWADEVARIQRAGRIARVSLKRILEERPGPELMALYIAKAATALGDIQDAAVELQQIGEGRQKE